jgi:MFS superfamily sulfate permease-like transporter
LPPAPRTRQKLDANQELVGQGIGNIVGSLSLSYPTSGSFSRSAVNIGAGAITGFSSVVTSVIVVVTLLWLTPLLYHLPQATLAAVIMMAVVGLINVNAVKHAWQANKQDGVVAVAVSKMPSPRTRTRSIGAGSTLTCFTAPCNRDRCWRATLTARCAMPRCSV